MFSNSNHFIYIFWLNYNILQIRIGISTPDFFKFQIFEKCRNVKISVQYTRTILPFQLYKCLSIFLSLIIYLSICENICPISTHNHFNSTLLLSIYLSLSYYLFIFLSFTIYLLSIYLSIYLPICYISVKCPYTILSIQLYRCLSIYLSI